MLYDYDMTIPANTAQASAVDTECRLTHGRIARVDVLFPSGCAGLVHLQVLRGLHQLWPANAGGDINGDGNVVSWEEDYLLDDEPLTLTARVWNDDDTYPHTVTLRLNMLDTQSPIPRRARIILPSEVND